MTWPRHSVLLGVPSAAGASGPGVESAFAALREAGLVHALRAVDPRLEDRGHLSLFPFREDPGHPTARNLAGVACAAEAVVDELVACGREARPLVVGGGCSLLMGVVAAVARMHGEAPGIILLDAHADLNTPETSPSGLLDGMALALALGRGPSSLATLPGDVGWPRPEHAVQLGFRELDPGERVAIADLGMSVAASTLRSAAHTAHEALALAAGQTAGRPVVVHLDLDVFDPAEIVPKAGGPPGPGFSGEAVSAILRACWASEVVAALLVTGFDPAQDPAGTIAARIVDLLAGIVAVDPGARI